MSADRSNRADVRNPLLALPAMQGIKAMPAPVRALLSELLLNIQADARVRADKCWKTHKAPMAVYWKAVGVYCGHLARAVSK